MFVRWGTGLVQRSSAIEGSQGCRPLHDHPRDRRGCGPARNPRLHHRGRHPAPHTYRCDRSPRRRRTDRDHRRHRDPSPQARSPPQGPGEVRLRQERAERGQGHGPHPTPTRKSASASARRTLHPGSASSTASGRAPCLPDPQGRRQRTRATRWAASRDFPYSGRREYICRATIIACAGYVSVSTLAAITLARAGSIHE